MGEVFEDIEPLLKVGIAPTGLGYALFFERDSKGDGHAIFWVGDGAPMIF
jgi:hypothetical protein